MEPAESRFVTSLILLGLTCILLTASPASAADDFRLRPGARGKLCLECHDGLAEVLKRPYVHTPIAKGDCSGCHNPHTSDHELLLSAETGRICLECHDDLMPSVAKSTHQVFTEGKCVSCHDPHAADNKMILVRAGSELCFECHQDLRDEIADDDFEHEPVSKDCLECHDPHASSEGASLLKGGDPDLCLDCHQADKSIFKRLHKGYPVEKGRCTACHNPHGSSTEGILFDNVHEPVSDRKCHECHEAPTAASPFALKETGFELCEGCHYEEVADTFNNSRIHWPVVDDRGCINCHAPHASSEDGLLKDSMLVVCGECHADTLARQERSQTKHPPIAEGECAECHSPHGSDNLFLLNEPSQLELCENCHEWQTHSTHPIGEEIIDPRNQNLTLTCSSCHRTHGTEFEHFMYFETINDMCTQCHTEYRR